MSDNLKTLLEKKEDLLTKISEICRGQAAMIRDRNINDLVTLDEAKKGFIDQLPAIDAEIENAGGSKKEHPREIGEIAQKINVLLGNLIETEKQNETALSEFMQNYTGKYVDVYRKMKK